MYPNMNVSYPMTYPQATVTPPAPYPSQAMNDCVSCVQPQTGHWSNLYPTQTMGANTMPAYSMPWTGGYPGLEHVYQRVSPWVSYGLEEAKKTSYRHAMEEVAMITYLMGTGMDPQHAHRLVESWEVNEQFPR